MMKKLLLIFCLTLSASYIFANKIDTLADNNIKQFLSPLVAKFRYPGADEKWQVKSWQKLDLNNDGLTDLIAVEIPIGSTQPINFVVMDRGNNDFQLINIACHYVSGTESIEPVKIDNVQLLLFHGYKYNSLDRIKRERIDRTDTLIYKYGNFVEFNKAPAHYEIESITYSSVWGWYGWDKTPKPDTDPDQKLTIDRFCNAVYTNTRSSNSYILTDKRPPRNPRMDIGDFNGTINITDFNEIYNLINYLSIKNINERYAIGATDHTSYYVHVKFKDGSVKDVADYGGAGTFGLKSLFIKLAALRDSQDWK